MLAVRAPGSAVIAVITLVLGFGLCCLGQTLERLLNDEQKGETRDASY